MANVTIFDAEYKCKDVLEHHNNILVSISGGSDSDVMLDMIERLKSNQTIHYVFFDTGIESQATKEHLDYLEEKYGIEIERIRAKVPVPLGCKLYGQPFLSKYVSEMLSRMQKHNFDFKRDGNKSKEELLQIYGGGGGWL